MWLPWGDVIATHDIIRRLPETTSACLSLWFWCYWKSFASILVPPNLINRWEFRFSEVFTIPYLAWTLFSFYLLCQFLLLILSSRFHTSPSYLVVIFFFFRFNRTHFIVEISQTLRIYDEVSDATTLSVTLPSSGEDFIAVEDESFPTTEEIVPRNPLFRNDFPKEPAPAPTLTQVISETGPSYIAELRSTYHIPPHIEIVPVEGDIVEVHQLEYCAFYVYLSCSVILSLFFR